MKRITLKTLDAKYNAHDVSDKKYQSSLNEKFDRLNTTIEAHIKDQDEKWKRIEPAVLTFEGGKFISKIIPWVVSVIGGIVAIVVGWKKLYPH